MTPCPTIGTGSFRQFPAGLAWPAHRQQRRNPPDPAGLVDLGFGRSRADRVETEALLRHLAGKPDRERVDASFGRRIEDVFAGAAVTLAIDPSMTIEPPLPPFAVDMRRTAARAQRMPP
jgi:hypothetical protein